MQRRKSAKVAWAIFIKHWIFRIVHSFFAQKVHPIRNPHFLETLQLKERRDVTWQQKDIPISFYPHSGETFLNLFYVFSFLKWFHGGFIESSKRTHLFLAIFTYQRVERNSISSSPRIKLKHHQMWQTRSIVLMNTFNTLFKYARQEVLSASPLLVLYHDLLTEGEMSFMKDKVVHWSIFQQIWNK